MREDYLNGSGLYYIYIKYSFSRVGDLIASVYDAIILEDAMNVASNTDEL